MNARGFTLIELLVAMVIVTLLAGVMVYASTEARSVFERVPAVIDMQQRGDAAINVLSQALRASVRVTAEVPEDEGGFSQLTVVAPVENAARGVLAADQAAPAAMLMLAASPCPHVTDVCGFTAGAIAMIADDAGFDVFIVASTNAALRLLTPVHPLSRAYAAGSALLEVEQHSFGLDEQVDGSYSLTRVTAAGAVQPLVDGIRSVLFFVNGRRVDLQVVVHASTPETQARIVDRAFRASVHVRNVS